MNILSRIRLFSECDLYIRVVFLRVNFSTLKLRYSLTLKTIVKLGPGNIFRGIGPKKTSQDLFCLTVFNIWFPDGQ